MKGIINSSEALVAYLDMLGYSDLVRKKDGANIYYGAIDAAIYRWQQFLNTHEYNIGEIVKRNISFKVVSDTFVIVLDHQKALLELDGDSNAIRSIVLMIFSTLVSFLVQDCMRSTGLLFRGAVTKGQYYYKEFDSLEGSSFIFSRAFCDAADLEKRTANMPRILFDKSVLEGMDISMLLFRKHRPDGALLRDNDGLYYLNIYASVFSHTALAPILREVASILKRNLESVKTPEVLRKHIWFANYHNDLVRGIIDSEAAIPSLNEIKENQASMLVEIPKL